jgi:hypothetical protein
MLTEMVTDGDLNPDAARWAGERVLRHNARRLYGLAGWSA